MKKATLKKWLLTYKLTENNKRFIQAIRICKYPERTKEYKKLQAWLNEGLIENCGYCDTLYYQDNFNQFIHTNRNENL